MPNCICIFLNLPIMDPQLWVNLNVGILLQATTEGLEEVHMGWVKPQSHLAE